MLISSPSSTPKVTCRSYTIKINEQLFIKLMCWLPLEAISLQHVGQLMSIVVFLLVEEGQKDTHTKNVMYISPEMLVLMQLPPQVHYLVE